MQHFSFLRFFNAHYNVIRMKIRWRHSVEYCGALRMANKESKRYFQFDVISYRIKACDLVSAGCTKDKCAHYSEKMRKYRAKMQKRAPSKRTIRLNHWLKWLKHGASVCDFGMEKKHLKWKISSNSSINKLGLWIYTFFRHRPQQYDFHCVCSVCSARLIGFLWHLKRVLVCAAS